MSGQGFEIRPMHREELDLALAWAAEEGWNPGLKDAEAFWACDPQGFFVAIQDGRPVGSVSMVRYQGGFAFGGLFMVRPELRGQGTGAALAAKALEQGTGHVIGQDGVVAQQENYKRMGFKWRFANRRYQGQGGGEAPAGLRPLSSVPFEQVAALDLECFGYPREAFLRVWLDQPGGAALGKTGPGGLQGYGVLRPCREGFKIGPLFAQTPQAAGELFRGLLAAAPGQAVFFDAPDPNQAAVDLAVGAGMEPVFETARMYMNGEPSLPLEKIFGITSFELG